MIEKLSETSTVQKLENYAVQLTERELNAELEMGYSDMNADLTIPAEEVFADIRKNY